MVSRVLCVREPLAQGGFGGARDSYIVSLITFTDQIYRQGLEGTVASGTVCS